MLHYFPHKLPTTTTTTSSGDLPPRTTTISAAATPLLRWRWFSPKHPHLHHPLVIGFRPLKLCAMLRNNKEDQSYSATSSSSSSSSSSPSQKSSKLLTLPTILTIGRVASVPVLLATFYVESWWGPPVTTCIFIVAAITDWLDGYLARRMKLGTAFGAFLDPVADKLMVATTLVLLCTRPMEAGIFAQAPWLLPVPAIAIIGREITMSAVREWAASQGSRLSEAVAVNNLGKWKTATQMIALTILLGTRSSSIVGTGALVTTSVLLLYFSAWLAVWSLIVYVRKIWKVLVM